MTRGQKRRENINCVAFGTFWILPLLDFSPVCQIQNDKQKRTRKLEISAWGPESSLGGVSRWGVETQRGGRDQAEAGRH